MLKHAYISSALGLGELEEGRSTPLPLLESKGKSHV